MIEVVINHDEDAISSFTVKGHAGYARKGDDIYCAGVSAVTQTALIGLIKQLSTRPRYNIKEGWLECEMPVNLCQEDRTKAQAILCSMEAGLLSMQEAYPEYIRVEVRRL